MGSVDYKLQALKDLLEQNPGLAETKLAHLTDGQLIAIVEACQPVMAEEDQAFYRLAAARTERLQHELDETRKRLLEASQPTRRPVIGIDPVCFQA